MIREDRSNTTDLLLVFPGITITVPYSTFAGIAPGDPGNQLILDGIRDWIYTQLDTRKKKSTLPLGDPDRATDPALEGYFWDGQGGNPDIVIRPFIAIVIWDGGRYQYSFRSTEP